MCEEASQIEKGNSGWSLESPAQGDVEGERKTAETTFKSPEKTLNCVRQSEKLHNFRIVLPFILVEY